MLQLYFALTLGIPMLLAVHNEWEHRYRPPRVCIPLPRSPAIRWYIGVS